MTSFFEQMYRSLLIQHIAVEENIMLRNTSKEIHRKSCRYVLRHIREMPVCRSKRQVAHPLLFGDGKATDLKCDFELVF